MLHWQNALNLGTAAHVTMFCLVCVNARAPPHAACVERARVQSVYLGYACTNAARIPSVSSTRDT